MTDTNTLTPTDAENFLAQIDELVAQAREDDRLCYDQIPSQRYADARERIVSAVLAKWGAPAPASHPYAYEFSRSNEDGTHSLHIERNELQEKWGEYPELPVPLVLESGYAPGDVPDAYTADQMRAYVDADRAARKPLADSELHALYAAVMSGPYTNALHYWIGTHGHRFARAIEQAHGIKATNPESNK